MRNSILISILIFGMVNLLSCVQKTFQKTVNYTLIVNGAKGIKNVGIRGEDKPLSWEKDLSMNEVVPDSIYELSVTYSTGYKFAEVKFTIDGNFELQDMPNRRVDFSDEDTTQYKATYNMAVIKN